MERGYVRHEPQGGVQVNRFEYVVPESLEEAVRSLGPGARPIGGGTDLTEMMKDALVEPARIVSLKRIPDLAYIREESDGLRIGATTTLREIAESEAVGKRYPALAQAARAVASPQIRNTATLGGNLCQRPRCWYFRQPIADRCYKRGGDYCYAVFGDSSIQATFDVAACFAVHPSDTAIALSALGADIVVAGLGGRRTVPVASFFTGPEVDIMRENVLGPNELVAEVRVPAAVAGQPSVFLKAAPRRSIDFARASVAILAEGTQVVQRAAISLGGVALTPHRAVKAEEFLRGQRLAPQTISRAADLSVDGALPLAKNSYKVLLARGLVRQALTKLAA